MPPAVNLEWKQEKVVEEAPYRFVKESDYKDIFGGSPEFMSHGAPAWEELQPGEWEFGYRIYEFDPRMRTVTARVSTSCTLTQNVDVGSASGGELRSGQMRDAFSHASAMVSPVSVALRPRCGCHVQPH